MKGMKELGEQSLEVPEQVEVVDRKIHPYFDAERSLGGVGGDEPEAVDVLAVGEILSK